MRHPDQPPSVPALLILLVSLASAGCENGSEKQDPGAKAGSGARPLLFDPAETARLSLIRNVSDPGEAFQVRLSRHRDDGRDRWRIDSAGGDLGDRLADASFVNHVIDTLSTLHLVRSPSETPKGPLSSFGLEPPRYALKWTQRDGGHYEVRVGTEDSASGAHFITVKGSSRVPEGKVLMVKGALFPMLERLTAFRSIRHDRLATVRTDGVRSVEVLRDGAPAFSAARSGAAGWRQPDGSALDADVSAWLEGITHLKVTRFIDDPKSASRVHSSLTQGSPALEVRLKDHKGRTVTIYFDVLQGRPLAAVSDREGAAFELSPAAIRYLEPPRA